MTVTLLSPAKINWFLHITGQRADKYHFLQTYFQFINLCDLLTFTVLENPVIQLQSSIDIPLEQNLIYQAATLLKPYAPHQGIKIEHVKNIPIGGGLGGGSSNAATTLHALNMLWDLHLPETTLLNLGRKLGADVPIFVKGRASFAEGIGDELTKHNYPETWLLVVAPNCQVPTKKLFADPELTRTTSSFRIGALKAEDGLKFKQPRFKNDFEPVVRKYYTAVAHALDWLNEYSEAHLSGSGCCVFAPFPSKDLANAAAEKLPKNMRCWVVSSFNQSPLMDHSGKRLKILTEHSLR